MFSYMLTCCNWRNTRFGSLCAIAKKSTRLGWMPTLSEGGHVAEHGTRPWSWSFMQGGCLEPCDTEDALQEHSNFCAKGQELL